MRYDTIVINAPIFVSVGILASLSSFLSPVYVVLAPLLLGAILWFVGEESAKPLAVFLLCVAMFMGLGVAVFSHRMHKLSHHKIKREEYFRTLEGEVVSVRQFAAKTQIILRDVKQLAHHKSIGNIRLNSKRRLTESLCAGDRVRVSSVWLGPIPRPAAIDGYDFSQVAYFQRLSATGFFSGKLSVLVRTDNRMICNIRSGVREYILRHLSPNSAALLIAIATGDKSYLNDDTVKAIRNSGLAHMMAVSGFHMAILCGIIFAFVRKVQIVVLVIIREESWAMYQGLIASVFAAVAGMAYLVLVDVAVSAQRAYLMLVLFLLAAMAGRMSHGQYSLAIAALFILFSAPESLLSPSFQMSFMATLAIVVLYQRRYQMADLQIMDGIGSRGDNIVTASTDAHNALAADHDLTNNRTVDCNQDNAPSADHNLFDNTHIGNRNSSDARSIGHDAGSDARSIVSMRTHRKRTIITDALRSIESTALASLCATLATVPFSVYYFHSFATLGIVTNVIVAPIVASIIAPLFLLGVLLSPIELLRDALMKVVDVAIVAVIDIANYVAHLPYAVLSIPQIPFAAMLCFALCAICLTGGNSIRVVGMAAMFLGIVIVLAYPPAEVFVGLNNRNKPVVAYVDGPIIMTNGRKNFLLMSWADQAGCTDMRMNKGGNMMVNDLRFVIGRDVVIFEAGKQVVRVSYDDLHKHGVHQMWRRNGAWIIKHVSMIDRPWLRDFA